MVHRISLVAFILGCTFFSVIPNVVEEYLDFMISLSAIMIVIGIVVFIVVPEDSLEPADVNTVHIQHNVENKVMDCGTLYDGSMKPYDPKSPKEGAD
jgi:hypothetical protein